MGKILSDVYMIDKVNIVATSNSSDKLELGKDYTVGRFIGTYDEDGKYDEDDYYYSPDVLTIMFWYKGFDKFQKFLYDNGVNIDISKYDLCWGSTKDCELMYNCYRIDNMTLYIPLFAFFDD